MANFTAPLPPSRATGDAPSGGPAADVNLLAAALTEARGIIKTAAEIAADPALTSGFGAKATVDANSAAIAALPGTYQQGRVVDSGGATIPGKRVIVVLDANGEIDDLKIETVA